MRKAILPSSMKANPHIMMSPTCQSSKKWIPQPSPVPSTGHVRRGSFSFLGMRLNMMPLSSAHWGWVHKWSIQFSPTGRINLAGLGWYWYSCLRSSGGSSLTRWISAKSDLYITSLINLMPWSAFKEQYVLQRPRVPWYFCWSSSKKARSEFTSVKSGWSFVANFYYGIQSSMKSEPGVVDTVDAEEEEIVCDGSPGCVWPVRCGSRGPLCCGEPFARLRTELKMDGPLWSLAWPVWVVGVTLRMLEHSCSCVSYSCAALGDSSTKSSNDECSQRHYHSILTTGRCVSNDKPSLVWAPGDIRRTGKTCVDSIEFAWDSRMG